MYIGIPADKRNMESRVSENSIGITIIRVRK